MHSRRHTGVDVLEKSVSSLESAAVRLGSSDIRIISDTVPVLFLLYLLGRARFGANGVAGERKREGADGAAGGAARAPDELETREAEAGMRKILVPECVVHDTHFATTPRRRLALAVNLS